MLRKIIYYSFILLIILPKSVNSQDLGDESYGIASFYAANFYNKKTANQELLKRTFLTAAHRIYPFNTLVEVTNINNKKSIIVRINDRGPYKSGRIIDLTEIGAKRIGLKTNGLANVKIKIVGFENELMLIPYQHLTLETLPKFNRKYYQKTKLKYRKKYHLKKNITHKKYLKKRLKKKILNHTKKIKLKKKLHVKPKKISRSKRS